MSIGTSNYAAGFIITNFLLASLVFSARPIKNYLKIDRNIAPREDLSKYGATEVQNGRLSQETLDVLKRLEACHANAMEHLPFFIGTMLFALHAGLPSGTINFAGIAGFKNSIYRSICIWHNPGRKLHSIFVLVGK